MSDFHDISPNTIHSKIKSTNKNANAKADLLAKTPKNKQNEKNPTNFIK